MSSKCFFSGVTMGILLLLIISPNLSASHPSLAFLNLSVGARAVAMGSSFVSIADDVNSLWWNPAGSAQLENKEVTLTHNIWLAEMNHTYLGFCLPLKWSTVGLSINHLDMGKFDGRDEADRETSEFTANSICIAASCGWKISKKLLIGITLKGIQEKIESETATAFAGDIGGLWKISENMTIGLLGQNFGTRAKFIEESANLPTNIKIGFSLRLLQKRLILSLDLNNSLGDKFLLNFGTEYSFKNTVFFRVGYKYRLGSDDYIDKVVGLTSGMGFRISLLTIDYAFVPYGDLGNTHRISLSLKF